MLRSSSDKRRLLEFKVNLIQARLSTALLTGRCYFEGHLFELGKGATLFVEVAITRYKQLHISYVTVRS